METETRIQDREERKTRDREIIRLEWLIKFSTIMMLIYFSVFFIVVFNFVTNSILGFLFVNLGFWSMNLVLIFLLFFVPMISPLSYEGDALLSLKEFSKLKQNQKDTNFGYIKRASKKIAGLLEKCNVTISSNVLSEYLSQEQLESNNNTSSLTIRIIKSLDPLDMSEIAKLIGQIPDIREKHHRLTFSTVIQGLSYIVVILATLVSLIVGK